MDDSNTYDMRVEVTLNIDKDILEESEKISKEEGYNNLPFLIEQYIKSMAFEYQEQNANAHIPKKHKRITALKEQLKDIQAELTTLEAEIVV